MCVSEELRDNAGLGDDVAVVREAGYQAALYADDIRFFVSRTLCRAGDVPAIGS